MFSRSVLALCLLATAAQAQTFTKVDGRNIPDGTGFGPPVAFDDGFLTSDFVVSTPCDVEICDLKLSVDITHTWNGDLDIELELQNDMGMKTTMIFGNPSNCPATGNIDNIVEIFADGGSGDVCAEGGAEVDPIGQLSDFTGYNVGGTWTLTVADYQSGDLGTLNSWSLIVEPCAGSGVCMGDPHFQTWNGEWYDFHGQCDLVYLDNPEFDNGAGLSVHIRTSPRYEYSYIETAAVKIGQDVLEIGSWGDYFFNGVRDAKMPLQIGGYTVTHTAESDKKHIYDIDLLNDQHIIVSSFKDMVSVKMIDVKHEHFKNSVGLLGKYGTGTHLGRNGTVIEDVNDFGMNWQVQHDEPMLFQTARHPQHPVQCVMPIQKAQARRLGHTVAETAANAACEHWGDMKEQCVFDVMATGDLELAGAW